MWVCTCHSFLKFTLRWTDSNSFAVLINSEILEVYVVVLSAIHETFVNSLTSGYGRIVWIITFVVKHSHMIYFGQWNGSRNNVCYFEVEVWRICERSATVLFSFYHSYWQCSRWCLQSQLRRQVIMAWNRAANSHKMDMCSMRKK